MPWTYVNSNLNAEEIVGTFYEKELRETNQTKFRVGKVIEKGDKLYVKCKGYDFHLTLIWVCVCWGVILPLALVSFPLITQKR